MNNTERFLIGVGVAVIGFILKELIVFLIKRHYYKTTLIYDIVDVVEKFESFGTTIKDSPPQFSPQGDVLKFRWSDGRDGHDVSFKDIPFVDPVDLSACENFYGALGRYGQLETKYNDLIISYFTDSDPRAIANTPTLIEEIHNAMVSEVEEIVRSGKEALISLRNSPRTEYRPAKRKL